MCRKLDFWDLYIRVHTMKLSMSAYCDNGPRTGITQHTLVVLRQSPTEVLLAIILRIHHSRPDWRALLAGDFSAFAHRAKFAPAGTGNRGLTVARPTCPTIARSRDTRNTAQGTIQGNGPCSEHTFYRNYSLH